MAASTYTISGYGLSWVSRPEGALDYDETSGALTLEGEPYTNESGALFFAGSPGETQSTTSFRPFLRQYFNLFPGSGSLTVIISSGGSDVNTYVWTYRDLIETIGLTPQNRI